MHRGQLGERHPFRDVDGQLATVHHRDELRELFAVASDEHVHGADVTLLVPRRGDRRTVVLDDDAPGRTVATGAASCSGAIAARFNSTSTGWATAAVTSVVVVDDLVGAGGPDPLAAARARSGDHMRAGRLGQLHRITADRPAGADDQHVLSGRRSGVVEERLPRGEAHHRQRGRVGNGMLDGAGARFSAGARTCSADAPSATIGRKPMTLVIDVQAVHAVADRVDRAGDVDAGGVRERHRDGVPA